MHSFHTILVTGMLQQLEFVELLRFM